MPISIHLPSSLRKLTQADDKIEVLADRVDQALEQLVRTYPAIKEKVFDEKGDIRRFVNIYVNEEDIRFLDNQATPVKEGDEISIIPAIAGG